jgi:probable FeS assembly SUF system protein SufT
METIELTRDCVAVQIPDGTNVTLNKGTPVDITQTLGGTYTVRAGAGLFRIGGNDADALGKEVTNESGAEVGPVTIENVHEMLKNCFDPEIPVNIVDLGLVYDTAVEEAEDGAKVSVKMTLTAPGCGMGPSIAEDAQNKILALNGVGEANVEIVWDPPWHQSMITGEGRKILGME